MPHRNLTAISLALVLAVVCYQRASHNRYASAIADAIGEIDQNFVEEVNRRELFEGSMRGMIRQLDPYSGFVSSDQYLELKEDLDQEFGGVGIMVDVDPESDRLMVVSPLFGTPAYHAGVRAGDLILEIDGQSTEGMSANESVGLVRGPAGSSVVLTMRPLGTRQSKRVTLLRAIIPIESVLGDQRDANGIWTFTLADHPEMAYIRLDSFGDHSAEEIAKALHFDSSAQGLILDLRGNPGGLLVRAVEVCDLFLDK